ncbi:MAG TPA: ABC transporter permease [Acidobacteriota bacterium]|nr:ABC transporter permease [Acidobacteriota bacterium]HNB73812.1 ABC transporter permease [Acidobacteriota bacterium]HND18083.1 ABC transporter permease [Acidobacteriota bacterium]HNG93480.1 ABC transporter permease [Acidobacteriota bacterium]HNH83807.1 ABC transporter permease [Acidobacteriota bacterium]
MFSAALWESIQQAFASLSANKLRTLLTLIGIVVGVTAVIAVVTVIEGLNQKVAQTFASQGSNVFSVRKLPQIILSRDDLLRFQKRKDITEEDARFVTDRCHECDQVGWDFTTIGTVKFEHEKSENVIIRGISGNVPTIESLTLDEGRIFTEQEAQGSRNVCIIGWDVVDNLFPSKDPLGKELKIAGRPYTVIGVSTRYGSLFGFSRDNFVMIPFSTFCRVYGTGGSINIIIAATSTERIDQAQQEVRTLMRIRRQKSFRDEDDGFAIESSQVFLDLYSDATRNIYLVSFVVSGISLIVGGIVIMNIMLVSVTERTREIGIRKAMGARRVDVLWQFLTEAVVISAIGGLIGIFCGFGLAYLISIYTAFPIAVKAWSAILGVTVSSLVGIVFGVYPANRAAQLDPIEALRAE